MWQIATRTVFVSIICILLLTNSSMSLNLCTAGVKGATANVSAYNATSMPIQNCGCINHETCLRKCCKPGYFLHKKTCYKYTGLSHFQFNLTLHENAIQVDNVRFSNQFFVNGVMKCDGYFRLNSTEKGDEFYVQRDGKLWVPQFQQYYSNKYYCIDNANNSAFDLQAFVCFDLDEEISAIVYIVERGFREIGMIISMPFLLATLIVYALLPERNLHMKALMFYVFSLLMAYICLVILQLNTKEIPKTECQVIAFFTFFFFMASFFWMNVICLDIWFTFSGLRGFNGSKRSAERKRLLFYCAYAWGLTIALSTTVFLINNLGNAGAWYHPNIGNGRCWFEHDYQQLFYFYGPMAVLIFANVVLFCLTAYKIRQSQNETKMLRRDDSKRHAAESDQQKFYLYMKLFLAMGVNWTMEFLSWIIEWKVQAETKYMFYVTDFCNAIYGVFIFFLFVCKMKIWCLLKKRYYTFMGKPYFARETTLRTHSSNFSGTESTMFSDNDHNRDSRPLRLNSMK